MGTVDPLAYPIDVDRYHRADHGWLGELDRLVVHAGPPFHRMGTRTIGDAAWLLDDIHLDAELDLRRRLVAEARAEVVAALPGSEQARGEVAALVGRWLTRHRPGRSVEAGADTDPLVNAALAIQEDLCLMQVVDGEWRLTAAVLCFPSYWRLADKIGRGQGEIHQPVPHYGDELEARVDRFFDRLPPDRIVARRNWGFASHPLLFAPDIDRLEVPTGDPPADLWLRSERQTLRRLPETDVILFTIRVQLAPAEALRSVPTLADNLLEVIDGWSPELLASRGGHRDRLDQIRSWLVGINRPTPRR